MDKPAGRTSHDIVLAVRRGAGVKKVGHSGTLDPLATGLLVLCLGSATRLSDYVRRTRKQYAARVRLGQTTDTYDADGQITSESHTLPDRETVEQALAHFRGELRQRPPAYSAIKRGGRKAYELARQGEKVELEPRQVEVSSLEMYDWEPPEFALDITCSAGTYIRSIAHDLGQALGCGAHLTALRRLASGSFNVDEAAGLDELQAAFAAGDWARYVRPADEVLRDWPRVDLPAEAAARVTHGQPVPMGEAAGDQARAYDQDGNFIATLRADARAGAWRPTKVFVPPLSYPPKSEGS